MRSFEASLNDSTMSFWANTVEITAKSMKKDNNIFRMMVVDFYIVLFVILLSFLFSLRHDREHRSESLHFGSSQ